MRPITLRAAGFACFRDDQPPLDFSALELFAISGATGAGKSSVLDAMTYALYGKVPRMGKQGVKELISHGRDRMTVTLTFAVDGQRYVVTRTTRRTGSGACQLDRRVGDATEHVACGVTPVNEAVRALLGLDYDAFTQAVMLPQGEFAGFLKGAAADRRRILQELLRLTVYNRMRELAGQRCSTARARVAVIEQQLQAFALATPDDLARLEAEWTALEGTRVAMQRAAEDARRRCDDVRTQVQLAAEHASRQRELATLLTDAAEQRQRQERLERSRRARQIAPALDQHDRDEATHASRVRDARTARGHLADAQRQHDRAHSARDEAHAAWQAVPALRERIGTLRALEGRLRHFEACRADVQRLERARLVSTDGAAAAATAAAQRQRERGEAQARVVGAEAALARFVLDPAELHSCEQARDTAIELRRDRLEVPAVERRLRAARTALRDAERVLKAERANADAAAAAHARAIQDRDEAWARQRDVWDAHRAMTLRSHLAPGQACPVCERAVSVVPPVSAAPEQKEADAAANETAEAVKLAAIVVQKVQEAVVRAAAAAEGAASDVTRALEQGASITHRIGATQLALHAALSLYLPATADRMPEHWLLERLDVLRTLRGNRESAERACQVAREVAIAAEGAVALAVARRDAASREIAALDQQLEARQTELAALASEIACVTAAEDPRRELVAMVARLQQLEDGLADATGAAARQEVALARAAAHAEQADRLRVEAAELVARIAPVVAQSLESLGCRRSEDARAALLREDDEAQLQHLCEVWTQRHALLTARVDELAARVGAAPASEQDLAMAVEAADKAGRAHDAASHRRGELAAQLTTLRQRLEEGAALRTQLTNSQTDFETYGVLSADLQANAFQDWLLTEVFERIVRGASTRLMELTSRYTLDWIGNEFYVVDHDNARERRTADTLSGGETFLASLALALELSEQVQRAAGAVRLDSLFIDEGFGSLDANAQDVVASAIESLQVTGRMVGIITHVRELTDRMPAGIVIDKRADGSRWAIRHS